MRPDFQDEIVLQLTSANPDPEVTFSFDGVGTIADQFHDFVLARINGVWKRTRKAPKNLAISIKLAFSDKPLAEDLLEMSGKPWSSWKDSGDGLRVIDSSLRKDAYQRRN